VCVRTTNHQSTPPPPTIPPPAPHWRPSHILAVAALSWRNSLTYSPTVGPLAPYNPQYPPSARLRCCLAATLSHRRGRSLTCATKRSVFLSYAPDWHSAYSNDRLSRFILTIQSLPILGEADSLSFDTKTLIQYGIDRYSRQYNCHAT
jgi:hypothetical protein